MKTITIDLINEKVINLLHDLEKLKLIRLRNQIPRIEDTIDWRKYKGAMSKQNPNEVDQQLRELRDEW